MLLSGCSAEPEGSEQAARAHFQNEFKKWIGGEKSEVTTMAAASDAAQLRHSGCQCHNARPSRVESKWRSGRRLGELASLFVPCRDRVGVCRWSPGRGSHEVQAYLEFRGGKMVCR